LQPTGGAKPHGQQMREDGKGTSPMPQIVGENCIRRSQLNVVCIIFVHGILSDGEKAWTNPDGVFWPHMLADHCRVDATIYSFSYRSDLFCRTYSLADVVDSIREFFNLENIWRFRRVVFVCHSMGGIAVRRFVVSSQTRLIENKIDLGIFLIASPSLGSADANALLIFARLVRNTQAQALTFSQRNVWLNELNNEFRTLKESGRIRIKGKELVEDEPILVKRLLGFQTQVVEPFSAAVIFGEPYRVPFSDHISIAKPDDATAIQHRLLDLFIREMCTDEDRNVPPDDVLPSAADEARSALAALGDTISRGRLPRGTIASFSLALTETRRYMAGLHGSGARNSAEEERISGLWADAGNELYVIGEPELASRCMIKSNGWLDDSVWDDPRYRDLPLKRNDMMEGLRQASASQARDVVEGECEVDTLTWRTRVMLPPFREAPQITLARPGGGASAEPEIESITPDQCTIRIKSSNQSGKWGWRARGTLLR
jgi:hypothetical protein